MIEEKTTRIIKCDLCLKELDGRRKHTRKYLPLRWRMTEFLFGTTGLHLCKGCWEDSKQFIKDHRTVFKLKEE